MLTQFRSVVLRENYRRVWSEPNVAAEAHIVAGAARKRNHIEAPMVGEYGAIAAPITVEPHTPAAPARKSDAVGVVASIREVEPLSL
jgi:hypothetical protein